MKRFFSEFPSQFVRYLGENGAPEYAELGVVWRRRRKGSERGATGEADRAVVGTVAQVHNYLSDFPNSGSQKEQKLLREGPQHPTLFKMPDAEFPHL
jgi:hypothetical protein